MKRHVLIFTIITKRNIKLVPRLFWSVACSVSHFAFDEKRGAASSPYSTISMGDDPNERFRSHTESVARGSNKMNFDGSASELLTQCHPAASRRLMPQRHYS